MSVEILASHRDLLTRPVHGVPTTVLSDGQPQSSLVWVDYDEESPVSIQPASARKVGTFD
jgi:hypothetical protein